MSKQELVNKINELEQSNKFLSTAVHDYGNLIQRMYCTLMVNQGEEDKVLVQEVYSQLTDFISKVSQKGS